MEDCIYSLGVQLTKLKDLQKEADELNNIALAYNRKLESQNTWMLRFIYLLIVFGGYLYFTMVDFSQ